MNDTASLFDTEALLSDGIKSTPPSFVRSILKAASDPNVTSFARWIAQSHFVSRRRTFEIDGARGG